MIFERLGFTTILTILNDRL